MKALVCTKPFDLEYRTMPSPDPSPDHTVIQIKRIGICGTDLHAYEGTQPYFSYPRILGHELSGTLVEATGDFRAGEPVAVIPYFHCGTCIACRSHRPNCCVNIRVCGVHIDGGMVEYLSVPKHALIRGEQLTYDELALLEPMAIGAHGVRRAAIQRDEFVLVVGAGPIGLATMEFARIAGGRVIAMDVNEQRLRFCKDKIGIPHVVHARGEGVVEQLMDITQGDMPTVVIDATGNQGAINGALKFLAHSGRYVLIGLQKNELIFSHPEFHKRETTLMSSRNATRDDFDHVVNCLKSGMIDSSTYITHKVSFNDVKTNFESWLNPETGVIKAMIEME